MSQSQIPSSDPATAAANRSLEASSDALVARRRDSWRVNKASNSTANALSANVRAAVPSACSRHGASATAVSRDTRTIIGYSGTSLSVTNRSTPSIGLTMRNAGDRRAARDASN